VYLRAPVAAVLVHDKACLLSHFPGRPLEQWIWSIALTVALGWLVLRALYRETTRSSSVDA
jgi:hypothetical protein